MNPDSSVHRQLDFRLIESGLSVHFFIYKMGVILARLILDLSEAFDSVNHKVLVTRLWSMAGVGWAPFEVSW